MRKLALLLALIVCGPALGQVSVVQSVSADHTSGATTSVGVAFTAANITTGNYIVASCGMESTSGTISVTDNASGGSNTYTDAGSGLASENVSGNINAVQTFKAKIVNGGGTKPTVTCHYTSSQNDLSITATEVTGVDSSTFADTTANASLAPSASPAVQTLNSGSVTTSFKNDMLFVSCIGYNGTWATAGVGSTAYAAGGGFSVLSFTSSSTGLGTETQVVNTAMTGIYVPTFIDTNPSGDVIACNTVAIKAASQTAATGVQRGNVWEQATTAESTTRSWTHTVVSTSNSLLVVKLHTGQSIGGSAPAVTFNSVAMTNMSGSVCWNATTYGENCVVVFTLVNPPSGAHTVAVTYTATTSGVEQSEDFENVNQSTPTSGAQTSTGTAASSSLTVTTGKTGDWVDDALMTGATTIAVSGSMVQDWQYNDTAFGYESADGHAPGAASVTLGWTFGGSKELAHIAFDIEQGAISEGSFRGGPSNWGGPASTQ